MEMQKIRTVTFCGHSELTNPDAVRVWLMETVESLISQGAVTFYLGGYGAFDHRICAGAAVSGSGNGCKRL